MKFIAIVLFAIGIAAFATIYYYYKRNSRGHITQEVPNLAATESAGHSATGGEMEIFVPTEIHFGTDPDNPAVTLRPMPPEDILSVEKAPEMTPTLGVASSISSLMQAAPSFLVAGAHHGAKPAEGRQLMEVVINGKLIRTADGEGFRAMSKQGSKIDEHAKLYKTRDTTALVNAAAAWQLASVIVAQKHMADISQKLGEIKQAVSNISDFLDSERRAVISGTYDYLQQAYEAFSKGELRPMIRSELESCERDMLKVQHHLMCEIQRHAGFAPKDEDTVGTESLYKNSVAKYQVLLGSVNDLKLCIRTRALAWYVLSLYPGDQALKTSRWENIHGALTKLRELQAIVENKARVDAGRFKAVWNSSKTLEERKHDVLARAQSVTWQLNLAVGHTKGELTRMQASLQQRDTPTQIIVEMLDGKVLKVRQRELPHCPP